MSACLLLAACGGAGGGAGGGGTASQIATLLGYQSAEGSKASPLALGDAATAKIVLHEHGTVASGGISGIGDLADSYYSAKVSPGVEYLVTLSGLTDDADLYVYNDDGTFSKRECANRPFLTGTATETCTFTANRDTIYVAVDGFKTVKGAQFNLSVIVKPVSEGTASTPATLADPNVAPIVRPGSTVDGDDISYYTVNVNASPAYTSTFNASTAVPAGDGTYPGFYQPGNPNATATCPSGFRYYWYWWSINSASYDPATSYPTDYSGTIQCFDSNFNAYPILLAYTVHYTYDKISAGGCATGWYYGTCNQQVPRAYLITLTDLTDDVDLYVSDDTNFFSSGTGRWQQKNNQGTVIGTACQSTAEGTALELCVFPGINPNIVPPASQSDYQALGYPSTVPLYIAVDRSFASDGAAYTINVVPKPFGEGAPSGNNYLAPDMSLSYTLPVTLCTVFQNSDPNAPCFTQLHYQYDPVSLTYIYPDPSKTYAATCPISTGGVSVTQSQPYETLNSNNQTTQRDCRATVASGGAPGMPKVLDIGIDSFYRASVDPTKQYVLTLQRPTDAVDLYVFGKDGSFRTEIAGCAPPWPDPTLQRCTFQPTGPFVYFAVDGYPSTGGATYQLTIHEVYHAENSGAGTPKVLTAGTDFTVGIKTTNTPAAPYQGQVINGGALGITSAEDSYYVLSGLDSTGATQYRVRLANMIDDADLYVFGSDSSYGTNASLAQAAGAPCIPRKTGTASEACLVFPDSQGNIYLAVDGFWTTDGTAFDLIVEQPTSEGCVSWYAYNNCGGYYGPLYIGQWYPGSSDLSYNGFVKGTGSSPAPRGGGGTNDIYQNGNGDPNVSYYYAYVQPYDAQGNVQSYEVALSEDANVANVRLSVYHYDNDYSLMFSSVHSGCGPVTVSAGKASCVITPDPGDWVLLIAVDGYNANSAEYALTVKPAPTSVVGEGTASAPIDLGTITVANGASSGDLWGYYLGHAAKTAFSAPGVTASDTGDSFYAVNVTPGYTYYFGVSNYGSNTGPTDLYVYQDLGSPAASFSGTASCQPNASQVYNGYLWDSEWYYSTYYATDYANEVYPYFDKWCAVTATGSVLYIGVDGSRTDALHSLNAANPVVTKAQYNVYAYWGWY